MRIATVSEVPTPWLCLQHDLRLAGIDPAGLDRIADRGMAENMAALRAGAIDVVQLFQPLAEELIEDRSGHLWYAAATRGPCSYTTFYARRGVLKAKREEFRRLVRGPLPYAEMAPCPAGRSAGRNRPELFPGPAASAPRRSAGVLQIARHLGHDPDLCRATAMSGSRTGCCRAALSEAPTMRSRSIIRWLKKWCATIRRRCNFHRHCERSEAISRRRGLVPSRLLRRPTGSSQ